jgi:hypothetical protein
MKYSLSKEFFVVLKISTVYIIAALIVALIIDNLFNIPKIQRKRKPFNIDNIQSVIQIKKEESYGKDWAYKFKLFISIFLQVIICVIAVFYLRKFVHTLSFINKHKLFISPNIYSGEIVIAFIFIGTQYNLLDKLVKLAT